MRPQKPRSPRHQNFLFTGFQHCCQTSGI
jgi:hypothetical protein